MRRKLFKTGLGILAASVVLIGIGWFAFVPQAKEPGYEFVKAWGEQGSGPGQFHDPTGIAVANGEVFVADSRNDRIQVFDLEGNFKRQFGKPGEGLGELGRPMNLTIRGGQLYVPEYFNDRVQVFDLSGAPRRIIGTPGAGPGQFNAPGGVAVAANGDLFVADFYSQRVQQLRADGNFVRQWGETGQPGSRAGRFIYPTDVALGADGAVYVADGYADRIQVFGHDGKFIRKWGGPFAMNIHGPFNGWFTTITSLTRGPNGNIFVADFYNDRIQKFTPGGAFLTAFGKSGSGPAQFNHAVAVAVTPDDAVFAADFQNNRIQKWQPKGRRSSGISLPLIN